MLPTNSRPVSFQKTAHFVIRKNISSLSKWMFGLGNHTSPSFIRISKRSKLILQNRFVDDILIFTDPTSFVNMLKVFNFVHLKCFLQKRGRRLFPFFSNQT